MKRLDINDPNVWNKWRELYADLTDEEQKDFLNDSEERYPVQQHHTKETFLPFLKEGDRVLEIGGWKGELAAHCLSKVDLKEWLNIELCTNALELGIGLAHPKYSAICPKRFNWFVDKLRLIDADVCVSAHTIEHFSDAHLIQLIDYIAGIKTVVFEAPIREAGDDWTDYGGTHMLKMGWNGVNAAMTAKGYSIERINENCCVYRL